MNRILQFLKTPNDCVHCVAKRQHEALKVRCEALESEGGGAFEFCVPSVGRLAGEPREFDIDEERPADPPTVHRPIHER